MTNFWKRTTKKEIDSLIKLNKIAKETESNNKNSDNKKKQ